MYAAASPEGKEKSMKECSWEDVYELVETWFTSFVHIPSARLVMWPPMNASAAECSLSVCPEIKNFM